MEPTVVMLVLLPLGLGLLGFIEPCSIGSSLDLIKYLEGKAARTKLLQVGLFAATRAAFIGVMGLIAVALGTTFLGLQRAAWIALGIAVIGLLYIAGRGRALMVSVGPQLAQLSGARGSAALVATAAYLWRYSVPKSLVSSAC